jgi:tryptophan-rich sensory protein
MKLIISILVPLAVGMLSGYLTHDGVTGWYVTAEKPGFNPPNWVFAPVWIVLYISMGIALYLVWKSNAEARVKKMAVLAFAVQLALNFCWSFIFFKMQEPGWALVEIIALWSAIVWMIVVFTRARSVTGWMLAPYLLWVSFAVLLNYNIWELNKH